MFVINQLIFGAVFVRHVFVFIYAFIIISVLTYFLDELVVNFLLFGSHVRCARFLFAFDVQGRLNITVILFRKIIACLASEVIYNS